MFADGQIKLLGAALSEGLQPVIRQGVAEIRAALGELGEDGFDRLHGAKVTLSPITFTLELPPAKARSLQSLS